MLRRCWVLSRSCRLNLWELVIICILIHIFLNLDRIRRMLWAWLIIMHINDNILMLNLIILTNRWIVRLLKSPSSTIDFITCQRLYIISIFIITWTFLSIWLCFSILIHKFSWMEFINSYVVLLLLLVVNS